MIPCNTGVSRHCLDDVIEHWVLGNKLPGKACSQQKQNQAEANQMLALVKASMAFKNGPRMISKNWGEQLQHKNHKQHQLLYKMERQ